MRIIRYLCISKLTIMLHLTLMKRILMMTAALTVSVAASAQPQVTGMRVCGLSKPLGIDRNPVFSWKTDNGGKAFTQQTYELAVNDLTDGTQVWQTIGGSEQTDVVYAGSPLVSRHQYEWSLRVTGKDGSTSETTKSTFETAFLTADEWTAKWIGRQRDEIASKVEVIFEAPVNTQYLKIDITKLGLQADGDWDLYYLQFAEVEIFSNGVNVAPGATFTPSHVLTPYNANWNPAYINDGVIGGSKTGYTSSSFNSQNQHVTLLFNLKEAKTVNRVVMYPRQDVRGKGSTTSAANFPSSYSIQTSLDNKSFDTVYEVSDAPAPEFKKPTDAVPHYGTTFTADDGKSIVRARLYATALGVYTMQINGKDVTDTWLEPGETGWDKTINYSVYDVTSLIQGGDNTVTAQVAGAEFSVFAAPDRYTKPEIVNNGTPALIAELFVDYADGTITHVVTDGTWKTALSPVTATNWWGGEDYDARLELSLTNLTGWAQAKEITPTTNLPIEKGGANAIGKLQSRRHEPIRVVETWKAVKITPLANGHYVVDFGQNFAGQFRFNLRGKAGQTLKFQTGESLNADGTVNAQGYYGGQIVVYDTYTFKDEEQVEWSPRFMYHGFRYMEVTGLDEAPSTEDFTALRLRADVENVGSFTTSNQLINNIHKICRNSVQSQMFNTFTDCPQREKIGWLDVPNQMFNSITQNFDFQTFCHKIVQDCYDAQSSTGKVPSTCPHYMTDWDDDPNWGGSFILVPYRVWKTYGDASLMRTYYDGMKRLVDYYTSLTTNYIMPGSSYSGLSDWGQGSSGLTQQTTAEFTITCTYHYLLKVMAEMATATGHAADAANFEETASKVKDAFNKRFYNTETAQYEYGNQAEYGMALYYGLVDEDQKERVALKLAEKVKADNYKVKTGECGLKPVLMMLSEYGYDDIVWNMVNQTDYPSYGYFVVNGCTTTPEYWNMDYSQNHCMLDHIEEWFYSRLAGIQNGGTGYDTVVVAPYVPEKLTHQLTKLNTVRGEVVSEYTRLTDGIQYQVTIPANSVGVLRLAVEEGKRLLVDGKEVQAGENGITAIEYGQNIVVVTVEQGDYTFATGVGTPVKPEIYDELKTLQSTTSQLLIDAKVNDNTGYYSQEAKDKLDAQLMASGDADSYETEEALTEAYNKLLEAYNDFLESGRNQGGEPIGIADVDYTDLTEDILHEAGPFKRTDATKNSGRFGAPEYWIVENFGFGSEAGIDNASGTDCLHLEVWWNQNAFANAGYDIHNVRLYQKTALPRGRYYFGATYPSAEANEDLYIFAADSIMSTNDIPSKSIAFEKVRKATANGPFRGIFFTVESERDVYLGFQADFSNVNTNNLRCSAVKLLKYRQAGDVNQDGKVDINDVVAIINVMAGAADWPNANVNGDADGKVDINDVVAVINIMASL